MVRSEPLEAVISAHTAASLFLSVESDLQDDRKLLQFNVMKVANVFQHLSCSLHTVRDKIFLIKIFKKSPHT